MKALSVLLLASFIQTLWAGGITGPISANFQQWLQVNGYGADDFVLRDLGSSGSFGGKTDDSQKVRFPPTHRNRFITFLTYHN